ncbi:RNA polymerase sigma factor SigZ [Shewanella maritima]|uniref:RNA polymerase sigma factor SigZ n=1 Tax=Shewanella maritima TaxID=2520507 RepID=UPI003735A196
MTAKIEINIELIWAQYRSSLRAFLTKNVANLDDVDDLLQEVLIKTYNNLDSIRDTKKLKSWLFQIANNTIIDFYRKRGNHPTTALTEQHDMADEHGLSQNEEMFAQMSDCITPFINGLPKDQADLLSAIEIEGVAQKSYAESHNIKYSTLKSRVQKSRQSLYQLFNQCCEFTLDNQGNLVAYTPRINSQCGSC